MERGRREEEGKGTTAMGEIIHTLSGCKGREGEGKRQSVREREI